MKKIAPFVSIVVVNYNGKEHLKKCLDSLLKLNYPANRMEVLMVDNCSIDDSAGFVKKNFPKIKILKNDINNYARANNLGAKKAKGDFIAFVNNDVQVHENWLIELINVMDKEKRSGAAGGKILLKDGKIHSAGHEEYPNFYWGDRGFRHEDTGQYELVEEVASLCGAAVLFRKACLDDVGLLDEDFIMYLEDVEICLRCSKNKWKVLYVPKSIARHHFRGTSSAESVRYFSERNRLLLIAKHFPAQLGEALYGKGYFTGEGKSIYDVFPLIFTKLLERQRIGAVKASLPVIFKNFKKISILEKSILMDRIGEFKSAIIQDKALTGELNRLNAQLQEQIQRAARDMELKDALLREKDSMLQKKDEHLAGLNRANMELNRLNAQLQEQTQRAARDIELKDALLREKDSMLQKKDEHLAGLNRLNAQLQEQTQRAARDIELKDALVREKEVFSLELSRLNAQLQEQIQRAARDIELKDALLREKDSMLQKKDEHLAGLNRASAQLNEQIHRMTKDIESRDSMLLEKQTVLNQKETQLYKTIEELAAAKNDLEKIVRFDQKIKILLIKPYKITIEDTGETVRIIKKKYPNSSVYLLANLLKEDYEKLAKNNDVEKSLVYCRNGSKSFIKIPKLYSRLFLTRFDMAITLSSHKQAENYAGYKKAKLITMLSNSKNQCVYYVD